MISLPSYQIDLSLLSFIPHQLFIAFSTLRGHSFIDFFKYLVKIFSERCRTADIKSDSSIPQVNVLEQDDIAYRTALERSGHPYSKLNELSQIGAIRALDCRFSPVPEPDHDSAHSWNAELSYMINRTGEEVRDTATDVSKAAAKKRVSEAALILLTKRLGFSIVILPSDPTTSQSSHSQRLSSRQIIQMKDDRDQLKSLGDIVRDFSDSATSTACVSVDLEMYDRDQSVLLEVGLSYVTSETIRQGGNPIVSRHWILEHGVNLHNGLYCEGNKNKFNFGTSEVVDANQLKVQIHQVLEDLQQNNRSMHLVGHTVGGDIKWLQQNGVDLTLYGIQICDIGKAYRGGISPYHFIPLIGMQNMMTTLRVPFKNLHNGGNDAKYNLDVLFAMIEGALQASFLTKLWAGLATC